MSGEAAEQILRRARAAQPAWANQTPAARVSVLARLRRNIAAARDRIVEALVTDTGKPPLDALAGDVLVTLEQMLYYDRHAARLLASRRVRGDRLFYSNASFREHLEPHGVALIYGPANYPFQLAMVPAVTALYAGNAVVLKVSERAPSLAQLMEELAHASALPEGLLQVVSDSAADAGAYIDAGPDIVFFTGSSANGRQVAARAAARLIPTVLELGGKDAAIAFADCNLHRTVEGVVYGAFSNAGQVCVGIKRLYVEQSLYRHLMDLVVRRTAQLRVGSGLDCDLGTLRGHRALQLLEEQVADALERGAELHFPPASKFSFNLPIVLSNVPHDARLHSEETFGPVLCVQAFSTEAEAIQLANASKFALGASVWTSDLRRGRRVARQLCAGTCAVNDVIRNIAKPDAAFGGNAESGHGRYHGAEGLRTFSRIKTVMTLSSKRRSEINWFPFSREKYNGLGKLIELRHRPRGLVRALRSLFQSVPMVMLLLCAAGAHGQDTAHLQVKVEMPRGAHGDIAYLVFNSPDGFPQNREKAMVHGFYKGNDAQPEVTIDAGALPPGRYAVTVYLDENGNHKLDAGLFGIPREPVGASNNPRPRMGPPRFTDCAFQMGSNPQTITINLVKPR